jgi:asparagine synthase (glutamine-hydrolysing)
VQTRATFLDDLGGMFEHLEAPLPAVANRPWIEEILRLGSEDGVEVMLDGGGGNLTMSWDGSGLIAGLIRELRWVRAWREGEALAKVQGKGVLRVMGGGAMPLLPGWMWRGVQRVRGRGGDGRAPWSGFSAIAPGFAEGQRVMARAAEHHGGWTFRPSWPLTGVRLKTLTLSDPWTHIGAGYQTWFGVRQRSPAVDVRMVEFCLSVPEEQWLRDGQNKWLLRRAMAGRLPEVVLGNRRRGLQCADWLERLQAMRGQAMDLLDAADGSGLAREVLDLGRLRGLVDGLPDVAGTAEELMVTYRTMLCGGLMMAGFLVWFEGKAP